MIITNTSTVIDSGIKAMLIAPPGSGKTYMLNTLEDPTTSLIFDTEGGLLPARKTPIDVVNISREHDKMKTFSEVCSFLQKGGHKYTTVIFDSGTELFSILLDHCEKKYPDPKNSMQKWGEYNKLTTWVIKLVRDLPINVIMNFISNIEKDENNRRYNAITVSGSISNRLPQYFDEVFFLHADRDDKGNVKRYVQTQSTDQVIAKDRSDKLDMYEANNWAHLFKKIRGM